MPTLAEQMLDNANEAMKLTRKFFVVELDFSPASVEQLEKLFDDVDFSLRGGRSPENIELLTRTWGSYLGEVIRRDLGGQWIEQPNGQPAIQTAATTVDPHAQVHSRLTAGPDHNIWNFYNNLPGTS